MKAQPQTIQGDIIDKLNEIQLSTTTYASKDDLEYRRILRECDKLINVDPYTGYLTKGVARIIVGDEQSASEDFRTAIRISPPGSMKTAEYAWCQFLVNFGKYSEAQPLLSESAAVRLGHFGSRHSLAPIVGAIQWLNGAFEEAEGMQLEFETTEDRGGVARAAQFLSERGVSDEKLARILDLAGDVARDHLLRLGKCKYGLFDFDGELNYLVKFYVDHRDPEEAAEMTFDLCGRLAEDVSIPSDVHVTFEVL